MNSGDTYPPVAIGQVVFYGARRGVVCRPFKVGSYLDEDRPGVTVTSQRRGCFNVIFFDDYAECGYSPGEKIHNKPGEWTVTDVFVSQDVVDGLIAAHDKMEAKKRAAEKRRQKAVRALWDGDERKLVADYRRRYPWAIAEKAEQEEHKRVAKNLRLDLKRSFPKIKFSVKSNRNSVTVEWYAGPEREEVEALAGKYQNPYSYEWNYADHCIYGESPQGRAMARVFGRIRYLLCQRDSRTKEEADEVTRKYVDELLQEQRSALMALNPGNLEEAAQLRESIAFYEKHRPKKKAAK
ncbi:MAG TPA: LPD29 domain-containing protein [Blastocatellia bacterium]|nr:LPD29 domain-containing protein [Blastocatellia bacterium]